ncbi:MAG: PAS domain S-box protein [Myxococcota bacterium]
MPTVSRKRTRVDPSLIDHLADVVIELETDGRVAAVNRAAERAFGRSPEALVGCSFLELIAPEDRKATLPEFRKVVEAGSELTVRFRVSRADCIRVAFDATLRRFLRADGESAVAAVCREVTQPASEAALETLRSARYRAIFENGPIPLAVADASGSIVSANRAFKRHFSGIGQIEELIAAVHPAQRGALATAWYESTRARDMDGGAVDVSLVDASGARVWLALAWSPLPSESGERLFAIQGTDISPRKQVELALAELALAPDTEEPAGFQPLVAALARALDLDRMTLARIVDAERPVCESLVVWQNGEFAETGELALDGLPEATVVRGETCIHPAGVTQLLPAVADRIGRSLQSFAGQPLIAADGRVLGWIAGYAARPLQSPETVRDLLALAARPLARWIEARDGRFAATADHGLLAGLDTPWASQPEPHSPADGGAAPLASSPQVTSSAVGRDLLYRVIQQSADLVFVCDLDTTILFANETATHQLRLPGERTLSGRRLLELLVATDSARLRSEVLPRLMPAFPWCGELTLEATSDAPPIVAEATIFLFDEPNARRTHSPSMSAGTLAGTSAATDSADENLSGLPGHSARAHLAISLHDVSARRRMEEALRQNEARLTQARKMESVGRLAGGIAHDFNNLLTAIIGYSDLVLQELDPDHGSRLDVEEILRAAERAGGLTRQLLAFSRRQVLQPERVDLNAIVADIDRMLRRLIGEDIELVSQLHGELEAIIADPGQIEQVIVNLVVNARDAMPRGGRIEIETSNVECAAPLRVESGMLAPGRYVALRVSDTGTGMDEETRSQIFEPFFTTKEASGGTGLGLASAYGIISQSRGQIDVESRLGEGSAFTIYLPVAREALAEAAPADDAPASRGRETILLVEDSGPVRRLVERMLSRKGYTVLVAESATAALRHCSRHDGPIDLLLTDVVLPRISGPEIARQARALRPELRVLYMSGFTDETLTQHGLSSLEPDLLAKPFSSATVLARVRQLLDAPAPPPDAPAFLVEQPIEIQPLED